MKKSPVPTGELSFIENNFWRHERGREGGREKKSGESTICFDMDSVSSLVTPAHSGVG